MRIEVTAEDIRYGKRDDCIACPVALALSRMTGEPWQVNGLSACRRLYPHIPLPDFAREWIEAFDGGKSVEPFAFELLD